MEQTLQLQTRPVHGKEPSIVVSYTYYYFFMGEVKTLILLFFLLSRFCATALVAAFWPICYHLCRSSIIVGDPREDEYYGLMGCAPTPLLVRSTLQSQTIITFLRTILNSSILSPALLKIRLLQSHIYYPRSIKNTPHFSVIRPKYSYIGHYY